MNRHPRLSSWRCDSAIHHLGIFEGWGGAVTPLTKKLRELEGVASKPTWRADDRYLVQLTPMENGEVWDFCIGEVLTMSDYPEQDARLIVHTRNVLLNLLESYETMARALQLITDSFPGKEYCPTDSEVAKEAIAQCSNWEKIALEKLK